MEQQPGSMPTPTAATPSAMPATPVAPAGMPAAAPQKKGSKVLVIVLSILGGCLLIAVVGAIAIFYTAKKTVDSAIQSIESNPDYQKAQDLKNDASSYGNSYSVDGTTDNSATDPSDPYNLKSLFNDDSTDDSTTTIDSPGTDRGSDRDETDDSSVTNGY